MERCGICGRRVALVPDHCHVHDWLRGRICPACNGRMRGIDLAARMRNRKVIHWSQLDPVEPYLAWHARCPGCPPVTRKIHYKLNSSQRMRLFAEENMETTETSVHAEVITLTPALAEQLLAKSRPNRKLSRSRAESMARDIRKGRFTLNGETVKLDSDGWMYDGQHRCHAVVLARMPIQTLITYGGSAANVDSGRPRLYGDILSMEGHSNGRVAAAIIRHVASWDLGMWPGFSRRIRLSREEMDATVGKYPDIWRSVDIALRIAHKVDCPTSAVGFTHWLFAQSDRDAADEFVLRLSDGAGLDAGNAILALRERLRRERLGRHTIDNREATALIILAWRAWAERRPLQKLQMPNPLTNENFPRPS